MIRFFLRLLGVGRTNKTVYYHYTHSTMFPLRVYIDGDRYCIYPPDYSTLFCRKLCLLNEDGTLTGDDSRWTCRSGWDEFDNKKFGPRGN